MGNIMYASGSFLRPASIFSFLTHILIICIAVYGLPNFGRKLPPDLTVISFELLKVVEETNLDFADQNNSEKVDIKKTEENKDVKNFKETKKEITTQKPVKQENSPSEKPSIPVSPSEKPSIPVSPSEKPSIPVLPSEKPKKIIEKETQIQKSIVHKKTANIQKPIMKPQIQKEKIKKNKTNPN